MVEADAGGSSRAGADRSSARIRWLRPTSGATSGGGIDDTVAADDGSTGDDASSVGS
jgi:hypothetical protein